MTSENTNTTTAPSLISNTSLPTATNQSITTNKNTPVNISNRERAFGRLFEG